MERVLYQAYIWTGHLGIYLAFMNIFIHIPNSPASVQTIGSGAAVITYSSSAVGLDCTHGCSGTNLYIGFIPNPPPGVHVRVWLHQTRMQVGCIQDANMQQNR